MSGAAYIRQGAAINHSKQKRITSPNFDPSEKLSNASPSEGGWQGEVYTPPQKKEQRSSYYSLRGQSEGIWRSRSAQGTFTHGQSFFSFFLSLQSATNTRERGVEGTQVHLQFLHSETATRWIGRGW